MVCDPDIAYQLLATNTFRTVQRLKLQFRPFFRRNIATFFKLGSVEFPVLKSLKILDFHSRDFINDGLSMAHQFVPLFQAVSSTIEFFAAYCITVDLIPCCPKLKKFELLGFDGQLSEFSYAKFPSLLSISIYSPTGRSRYLEKNFEPHTGVTEIRVRLLGRLMSKEEQIAEEYLHIFWNNLSRQFPNTKSIIILDTEPFNHATFRGVQQAFPHLVHLSIMSNCKCDFTLISGMNMELVNEYLEAGLPFDSIPRRDSIFNFRELESLTLDADVKITNDIITHCLARIPKLKTVKFYWDASLSAQNIRDFLNHVINITIVIYDFYRICKDQLALLKTLSNVHLHESHL